MAEQLNPKRLGLAGGILCSVILFIWTLAAASGSSYGIDILNLWAGSLYLGYSLTYAGAVIGAVWGFIDVFVGLYIFAWLYNWLSDKV